MKKTIFEQMGGTYTMVGDYYLPNLLPAEQEEHPIGIWGQRHLRYIKQHHKVRYTIRKLWRALLLSTMIRVF